MIIKAKEALISVTESCGSPNALIMLILKDLSKKSLQNNKFYNIIQNCDIYVIAAENESPGTVVTFHRF